MGMAKKAFNTYKGSAIAARHRMLQKQVARAADKRAPAEEAARPRQAGARHYPQPPFPRQHLPKPGHDYWSLYSASGFNGMSIRNSVPGWRA
jgi:hypothetical protein